MRKVPHHGLLKWQQCENFYNGLEMTGKQLIDAYAGGDIGTKTPQEAYDLLEKVEALSTKIDQMHDHKAQSLFRSLATIASNYPDSLSAPPFQHQSHQSQGQSSQFRPQQGQFQGQGSSNGLPPTPEGKSSLEDMVARLLANSESQNQLTEKKNRYMEERFHTHETKLRNQKASIQTIDNQVGQIAKLLSERQPGGMPSNTEPNPNAHVKAITLRSDTAEG
ncbi:hypothetical protein L1987_15487 [Smallanthus sonchifolius]|uniref:Uncharacterized protein n=1 Tax=Smallanthus sonchifolius TaxID=185202 RepID=A0ACB9J678_9ASTR|nr:hypothetical protein L1987_15487 [Smallanthus sonchifolius]